MTKKKKSSKRRDLKFFLKLLCNELKNWKQQKITNKKELKSILLINITYI